ncbi:MAG: glycosyltransferase family 2 protein [Oscillospiraceae bacterium]|nr:glycosyltransferase family 2 protein [Oscillospiraceae bacterium]
MIKVSVIIPVYNVEPWLPACLDSVLNQSLRELEVICIDDASPDGCPAILDRYAAVDERVRVLHLAENHMQGYGRNRGLEMARGKYAYFLDSDDMITPTAMEELYVLAEHDALDGIFFDSQVLFETEDLKKRGSDYLTVRSGNYPDAVLTGSALLDLFCLQNEWLVYVQRQFWRRAFLIENAVFSPERTEHEDEFFSYQAILLAQRVRYVRKDYFIRRYRADSVMTRPAHPKDFHGYFSIYCKMLDFAQRHGLSSYGVEQNLLHMYECARNFLGVFDASADPADWFTEDERRCLTFFRALLRSQELSAARDAQPWGPLKAYDTLQLYGAGRVANSVFQRLTASHHTVTDFLVTSKSGNPDSLYGLPVREIASVTEQAPGSVIVVAMAAGMHQEVASVLEEKGFRYFLYAQNVLRGPFGGAPEKGAS